MAARQHILTCALTAGSLALGCSAGDASGPFGDHGTPPPAPGAIASGPTLADLPLTGGIPDVPLVSADPPAMPIVGGTLLVTRDGHWAIAADPDRDQIFVVDLQSERLAHSVTLDRGDAPTRAVEGSTGAIHIVARGGDVVSVDVDRGVVVARQPVCTAPRGVAFDQGAGEVIVTCQSGALVWLAADGTSVVRSTFVEPDLRDVLVDGDHLWISRFRHAELLELTEGSITTRMKPPMIEDLTQVPLEPHVARRLLGLEDGRVLMQHQRSNVGLLPKGGIYYGGGGCGGGITHSVLSVLEPGSTELTTIAALGVGFVADFAVSPDATEVSTVITNGIDSSISRAWLDYDTEQPYAGCTPLYGVAFRVPGQATAIAYAPDGRLLVQLREPAALQIVGGATIPLSDVSRFDTGQALFHMASPFGVACASCHPEGGDDGTTWNFEEHGLRRTMPLGGGLLDTAPFHWPGDRTDIGALLLDTMVTRMGMQTPTQSQAEALGRFLDALPAAAPLADRDDASVARGAELFARFQCNSCHAGPKYTDSQTYDVGTGGAFQVPSLLGVGNRAPLLHDGCAATLRDRLGPCGGDRHGNYADATESELSDLVEFLSSL